MRALPDLAAGTSEQLTGVTCPDCPGVLGVSAGAEHGHLRFRCRIGHVYSLQDLVKSKEHGIEDALWAPVTALEELAALLREAATQGHADGIVEECEQRAARAELLAAAIRAVLEENAPINLQPDDDSQTGES